MSITDILIRSISGYIFSVIGIILYFWYLRKYRENQSLFHIMAVFVFCYYLIGILTMTGIGKLKSFSPNLVLIPFAEMLSGPIDAILNIILFFPLGFFLPLLYKRFNKLISTVLTGFLFSLSIEIIQMFGRGATDVNDLITNTVGTILGYFTYKLLSKMIKEEFRFKFKANKVNDIIEVLFFLIYSFVIMVTVQPVIISKLFGLG